MLGRLKSLQSISQTKNETWFYYFHTNFEQISRVLTDLTFNLI